MANSNSPTDKRKEPRFFANLPVKIQANHHSHETIKIFEARITNISLNGLGLQLPRDLPAATDYSIKLNLLPHIKDLDVKVCFKWQRADLTNGYMECGAAIIETSDAQKSGMQVLIDYLQAKHKGSVKSPSAPRYKEGSSYADFVTRYRSWAEDLTGTNLKVLDHFSTPPEYMRKNIENLIGTTHIPVGLAGPIQVNGDYAQGEFFVPFATTEGTLVETYQLGMRLITKSGGATVKVLKDVMDITPLFILENLGKAHELTQWIEVHFDEIKAIAEETTVHGKLMGITPHLMGRRVFLNFQFYTADAMGMNIANIAADKACRFIAKHFTIEDFYLRSNFSSDKKPAAANLLKCYGKEVVAEATIPRKYIKRFFTVTPEKLFDFWYAGNLGSLHSGMLGLNAHFANGLTAIYMATGQDVAQVVNASIGINVFEVTSQGDLYSSVKMPSLIVGTVGGGTHLNSQKACLEIMGCYGDGKAKKLAEIIAATILGGELAICGALACGRFVDAHIHKRHLIKSS